MKIALDTNILVRNVNLADPLCEAVANTLRALVQQDAKLCLAPQVVFEFWTVATRPPEVNGLGWSTDLTRRQVGLFLEAFDFLPDPPDLFERWLSLCTRYDVQGRSAHDARLAAWMEAHGLEHLLTLNRADFARFAGLHCLVPTLA